MRKAIAVMAAVVVVGLLALWPSVTEAENLWVASATPNGQWTSVTVGYGKLVCFNVQGSTPTTVLYRGGTALAADAGTTGTDQALFPGDCFPVQMLPGNKTLNLYTTSGATIDVYTMTGQSNSLPRGGGSTSTVVPIGADGGAALTTKAPWRMFRWDIPLGHPVFDGGTGTILLKPDGGVTKTADSALAAVFDVSMCQCTRLMAINTALTGGATMTLQSYPTEAGPSDVVIASAANSTAVSVNTPAVIQHGCVGAGATTTGSLVRDDILSTYLTPALVMTGAAVGNTTGPLRVDLTCVPW